MTLWEFRKRINNISEEFDNCTVEISFESDWLGILDKDGQVIDEINIPSQRQGVD